MQKKYKVFMSINITKLIQRVKIKKTRHLAKSESKNPIGKTEAWHVLRVNKEMIHFRTSKIKKQNK